MKKSGFKKIDWDKKPPPPEYFKELKRVSKNQIIWGGNYMIENLHSSPCWLVWEKKFSEKVSFAMFEMAWTSFSISAKMCSLHSSQSNKIHPTQKPIRLYEWIYRLFAEANFKILDTHLGSGTNAIAAHHAKLEFVGMEIDGIHIKNGRKKFLHEIANQRCF